MHHDGSFWIEHHDGPGPLGWLAFAVLLVLAVTLVLGVARWLLADRGRHPFGPAPLTTRPSGVEEALQVARLRYARGEIDRDAYLRLAEDIAGPSVPTPPA
jgi:uncharacterized membrane protein